jgi:hypothetical protein
MGATMGKIPFTYIYFGKKSFLARIRRPISIKLGTNNLCIKGIDVCTNKGPGPLQRRDNCKKYTNMIVLSKIFFLKTYKARKAQIYII